MYAQDDSELHASPSAAAGEGYNRAVLSPIFRARPQLTPEPRSQNASARSSKHVVPVHVYSGLQARPGPAEKGSETRTKTSAPSQPPPPRRSDCVMFPCMFVGEIVGGATGQRHCESACGLERRGEGCSTCVCRFHGSRCGGVTWHGWRRWDEPLGAGWGIPSCESGG